MYEPFSWLGSVLRKEKDGSVVIRKRLDWTAVLHTRGGCIAFALFLGNRFGIDWHTFRGMRWYDRLKT